jgi:hypothetical protein
VNPKLNVFTVQSLKPGEWHMPFVDTPDITALIRDSQTVNTDGGVTVTYTIGDIDWRDLKSVSTARSARVSYFLPENGKKSDTGRDIELCARLSSSGHWSPFEHVATPVETPDYIGNFRSWKQYRKEFESESGGDRENPVLLR